MSSWWGGGAVRCEQGELEYGLIDGVGTELYKDVQASLRRKVATLEEDNWMFEAEKPVPS